MGIALEGADLQLHALDPSTKAWDPKRELQAVPRSWNTIGGNDAIVSAFSVQTRLLYMMAGRRGGTGVTQFELAAVDVDAAAVVTHPALGPAGIPGCTDCLMGLTL